MDSSTQYTNNLENYKKLMLMTEFILGGLEDDYVSFLKGTLNCPEWIEFNNTIKGQIEMFEITEEQIQQGIRDLVSM